MTTTSAEERLRDLVRLRRVRDRIDREYAQPLDVEALARGASMSAGHLSRQFRAAYGESVYSYLMTRRVERAMALLRQGEMSVTEVCFAVGSSSLGTFSTRFTELVGVPPSVYRKQSAEPGAGERGTTGTGGQDAAGRHGAAGGSGAPGAAGGADGPRGSGRPGVTSGSGAGQRPGELPPCVAKQVTRPVRNREARRTGTTLG